MRTRQLTLYVDGYFTSVWDAVCFVARTEKQLEFTTARALLRDGQGAPARLREQTAVDTAHTWSTLAHRTRRRASGCAGRADQRVTV